MDSHDLYQVRVIFDMIVGTLQHHLTILEQNNLVYHMQEVYGVSHKNACLIPERTIEDILEDLLLDVGIEGANRIVHEDEVFVGVHSTC